jgi:hypothetical protein
VNLGLRTSLDRLKERIRVEYEDLYYEKVLRRDREVSNPAGPQERKGMEEKLQKVPAFVDARVM